MKHQIITIGKDLTAVYLGIKEFSPEKIHLIITPETEGIYKPMLEMLSEKIEVSTYIVGPYKWRQIEDICREIHKISTGEFSYNLSEGTKIMFAAALSVAEEEKAAAFYITQRGDLLDLITKETRPLSKTIDNKEYIQLQGGNLHTYNDLKGLLEEDVVASYGINKFIENHRKEYDKIQNFFRRSCGSQTIRFPSRVSLSSHLDVITEGNSLRILKNRKTLLKVNSNEAKHILLEGGWWEVMVAKEIRTWRQSSSKKNQELWQSVIFEDSKKDKQTKNEIDILINDEHKLLIIECKSGHVSQGDIYKLDSVRETYGGDASKAMLISYYPLEESLQEKCNDLQVHFFAPTDYDSRIDHIVKLQQWLEEVVGVLEI